MQRVAVIGGVGAGKSWFSRELASRCSLPLVVLDDLYWRDGLVPSDDAWSAKHAALVAADRWVMDGDHRAVAPARFARADTVVWIDTPLVRRYWHIVVRAGRDDPAGFWQSIRWTTRYTRHGRPQTASALTRVPADTSVYRLRSRRAQRELLARATGTA